MITYEQQHCFYCAHLQDAVQAEAEAAAAKQAAATQTSEEPADLDSALNQLDDELKKLDELLAKGGGIPGHDRRDRR